MFVVIAMHNFFDEKILVSYAITKCFNAKEKVKAAKKSDLYANWLVLIAKAKVMIAKASVINDKRLRNYNMYHRK